MEFIKGVLKEELENSIAMQLNYEKQLHALPQGALVKKKVRGLDYYYLVYRQNGKVRLDYKGRHLSDEEILKYQEAKEYRAKYRRLLSEVKKQIRFLKGVLRGSQSV